MLSYSEYDQCVCMVSCLSTRHPFLILKLKQVWPLTYHLLKSRVSLSLKSKLLLGKPILKSKVDNTKRFKDVLPRKLESLKKKPIARNTMRAYQWAFNVYQEWIDSPTRKAFTLRKICGVKTRISLLHRLNRLMGAFTSLK